MKKFSSALLCLASATAVFLVAPTADAHVSAEHDTKLDTAVEFYLNRSGTEWAERNIIALLYPIGPQDYISKRYNRIYAYDTDLAEYRSHVCYNVTREEIGFCRGMFAEYYDLKRTLENGTLAWILEKYGLDNSVVIPYSAYPTHESEDTTARYWGSLKNTEGKYLERIYDLFDRTGIDPDTVTASDLSDGTINMVRYVTHRCYNLIGNDIEFCREWFGPYADLKETFLSGELLHILANSDHYFHVQRSLPSSVESVELEEVEVETKDPDVKELATSNYKSRIRSNRLYRICGRMFGKLGQDGCYARNHALIYNNLPMVRNIQ